MFDVETYLKTSSVDVGLRDFSNHDFWRWLVEQHLKVKYLQSKYKVIAVLFSKTIRSVNKSCVEYMYSQEMYNDMFKS